MGNCYLIFLCALICGIKGSSAIPRVQARSAVQCVKLVIFWKGRLKTLLRKYTSDGQESMALLTDYRKWRLYGKFFIPILPLPGP
jgi:hypothetical protein